MLVQAVMEFGNGEKVVGGGVSWARIKQNLPHRSMEDVAAYGRLFETFLASADDDAKVLNPGSIPKESIFMDKKPTEVGWSCFFPSAFLDWCDMPFTEREV